ncbi:hypothetical protein Plhal304r1_c054g0138841 [Plasmopara halstedii]
MDLILFNQELVQHDIGRTILQSAGAVLIGHNCQTSVFLDQATHVYPSSLSYFSRRNGPDATNLHSLM